MRRILGLADHERLDAAHLGRPLRRAKNQGAAFCVARGLRRQIQYLLGLAVLENGVVLHREVPRHHTQLPVILRAVLVGSILRLYAHTDKIKARANKLISERSYRDFE